MSLTQDLFETPAGLRTASKYTVLNGIVLLAVGVLFVAWPGAVQALWGDPPFVANEAALFRMIGLMLAIIGWLYLFGGRSGAKQIVASSVVERLIFIPAVTLPLAISGVFPHTFFTLGVLSPLLAIGAWAVHEKM